MCVCERERAGGDRLKRHTLPSAKFPRSDRRSFAGGGTRKFYSPGSTISRGCYNRVFNRERGGGDISNAGTAHLAGAGLTFATFRDIATATSFRYLLLKKKKHTHNPAEIGGLYHDCYGSVASRNQQAIILLKSFFKKGGKIKEFLRGTD